MTPSYPLYKLLKTLFWQSILGKRSLEVKHKEVVSDPE